jgi:hypothetical protein
MPVWRGGVYLQLSGSEFSVYKYEKKWVREFAFVINLVQIFCIDLGGLLAS